MIKLTDLRAGYGGGETLHGVSLRFRRGEITVLVGPNGCGKSTLLKAACGLLPHTGGAVEVDGRPLESYTRRELAQKLAILPQSRNLPAITAQRMVLHGRFPYLGYPRRYRGADYEVARAALALVGIEELAQRSMESLSGGERQKVYLAMALCQETPLVILDEPTTFLDVRHQLEVLNIARGLKDAGKTVVMVLHDLNLALRCADTLAVLDGGCVAAVGPPRDVAESGALGRVFGVRVERFPLQQGGDFFAFSI